MWPGSPPCVATSADRLMGDPRWVWGEPGPTDGNAAWIQHCISRPGLPAPAERVGGSCCVVAQQDVARTPSLPFPSLPFPSLPFPSLPFPSLPFPISSRLPQCSGMFAEESRHRRGHRGVGSKATTVMPSRPVVVIRKSQVPWEPGAEGTLRWSTFCPWAPGTACTTSEGPGPGEVVPGYGRILEPLGTRYLS